MNKRRAQKQDVMLEMFYIPHSSFIIHHLEGFMSKRKCLEEYDRICKLGITNYE